MLNEPQLIGRICNGSESLKTCSNLIDSEIKPSLPRQKAVFRHRHDLDKGNAAWYTNEKNKIITLVNRENESEPKRFVWG